MSRIISTVLPPLRDRIQPGVRVLFVGINPGVRSSLTGHHFAGYSNRFWKLLYDARLVPEPITYVDDDRLPGWGYGITNVVARPTPGIDTLRPGEYVAGAARLRRKIRRHRPAVVALVGVTVFRALFPNSRGPVTLGLQKERIADARVFVLPNPSGRNANYTYQEMRRAYRALARHHRTLAPSHPRTLAPSHPRTLAPSHPRTFAPSNRLALRGV
jgi:TDG/mug DNA glycosylase family protein